MEQTKVGIIYKEIVEAIKLLPLEQQAKLYNAIFEYQFTGEITDEDLFVKSFILSHRTNFQNVKARREASIANGSKGGAPKGNQNAKKTTENNPNQPKTTQNNQPTSENNLKQEQEQEVKTRSKKQEQEQEYIQEKESVKEKEAAKPPRTQFRKPTPEEIKDFALQNGLRTDAIADFCDYYDSNGWKVGKNPMKDWKATYRRWCRSEFRNKSSGKKTNEFLDMLRQDELEEQIIDTEVMI